MGTAITDTANWARPRAQKTGKPTSRTQSIHAGL